MAGVRKAGRRYEVFNTSNKRTLSTHKTQSGARTEARKVRKRNM